jgi:hypothetical protein
MKPTATLTPDGQAYDLNATAILLISADTAYGEGMRDTPPTGQARAAKIVRDLLAAATAGGYAQADILESLLAPWRVIQARHRHVRRCHDAAGNERIRAVFEAMRLTTKGGAQ